MSCIAKHLPEWIDEQIVKIIEKGCTAEVKKEKGEFVVIEIKRKLVKPNN